MPKTSGVWFDRVVVKGGEYDGPAAACCAVPGEIPAENATAPAVAKINVRCLMMPPLWLPTRKT
jgi:hypothetical protein